MGGAAYKVVAKGSPAPARELAIDFVLYGTLAEIFARANGLNNFSIATEAGQKATGLQKPKPTPPENSR